MKHIQHVLRAKHKLVRHPLRRSFGYISRLADFSQQAKLHLGLVIDGKGHIWVGVLLFLLHLGLDLGGLILRERLDLRGRKIGRRLFVVALGGTRRASTGAVFTLWVP